MTSYKIQFRLPEFRWMKNGDDQWRDIQAEEYRLKDHAELRMKAFWEKEFPVMEFRVETVTKQKCPTESV